jgi:hypothetical protein
VKEKMSDAVYLMARPGCAGSDFMPVSARETARHNSIARIAPVSGKTVVHDDFLRQFPQVAWTVCRHCALVFARRLVCAAFQTRRRTRL